MDGADFVFGAGCIALGIYYGLCRISEAIRLREVNIRFRDPIVVSHEESRRGASS